MRKSTSTPCPTTAETGVTDDVRQTYPIPYELTEAALRALTRPQRPERTWHFLTTAAVLRMTVHGTTEIAICGKILRAGVAAGPRSWAPGGLKGSTCEDCQRIAATRGWAVAR